MGLSHRDLTKRVKVCTTIATIEIWAAAEAAPKRAAAAVLATPSGPVAATGLAMSGN